MPQEIARRLGRSAGTELEAIFKAPFDYLIETEDGWKSLNELPKRHPDWHEGEWVYVPVPVGPGSGLPSLDPMEADPFGLPAVIYYPVLIGQQQDDRRPYSNAQFGLALPHEELAVIVSGHDELRVEAGVASGSLTDIGARLLLVRDGHENITPVAAAGRFKLWMSGGMVTKYVVELSP